jgi:hypothetical protein
MLHSHVCTLICLCLLLLILFLLLCYSGRLVTSQGRRDLDQVAGTVVVDA